MSIIHGFGGGSSGGGYYTISQVLSQYLTENGIGTFTAQPTTGGGQNGLLMQAGELDIAVINGADCLGAYTGTREGFSEPYTTIRALAILYSGSIQIAVKDTDEINNFIDLKGRKFGVGNTGSGDNGHVNRILAALGMTIDDINAQYIGATESSDQLRDGQIDGFFQSGSVPYGPLTELVMAGKAKLLGFTQDQVDALCSGDSSVYFPTVIPAGTYDNQTEDVLTVALPTVLCVDANRIDEETAYMITKALYEDPAVAELYAGFDLDPQVSVDGVKIPLHDGAIKYYEEIGIL